MLDTDLEEDFEGNETCRECDDYGEMQCSRHSAIALARARELYLDWEMVYGARVARVARRHGQELTSPEVRALGQRILTATPDPLAERARSRPWQSCPRCALGLRCGCELPF